MIESEQRAVLTYGPDPSKAFGGLTPQQYSYCRLRAQGALMVHAYREAFNAPDMVDAVASPSAWKLEQTDKITSTINRMVMDSQPVTSLVPQVNKDFVLQGITTIALKETAKDNVRLRAYELLGKAVGLFKEEAPQLAKPRTIEEIDTELKARLSSMLTVEGTATRVSPDPEPSPTNDRRRKPKT